MLQPLRAALDNGQALHSLALTPEQSLAIRSFQLFSEKRRMVIVNLADDDLDAARFEGCAQPGVPVVAVSMSLQLGLAQMEAEERREFCEEMGVTPFDRESLVRRIMDVSGQMLFFTAGDKEVRTWIIRRAARPSRPRATSTPTWPAASSAPKS